MKKRFDELQREVAEEWEKWPGRKQPSDTFNMPDFYKQLDGLRPDLFEGQNIVGDELWQRVKIWLVRYERSQGRENRPKS
jgi:hypothetical protein